MQLSAKSAIKAPHSARYGEAGYMLLAVVVMTALVLLSLSVAVPVIARDLRRDKEVESEMRALQYVRAIRLYQRKFPGQYPPSMEALENTNNVRFLRKQYVDPLTGQANWRVIHLGQQQTTIKIPFGQELAGLSTTGIGSAAPSNSIGSPIGGSGTGSSTSTSTIGSTSALTSGFLGASTTTTTPGTGMTGASGSTGSSSSSSSIFGNNGGAGPIVGVGTSRTGDSILTPNGQTTYDTWEFWYDPRIELLYKGSNILGGGGLSAGTGSSSGINSTSASSFGQDAVSGASNSSKSGGSGVSNTPVRPQ